MTTTGPTEPPEARTSEDPDTVDATEDADGGRRSGLLVAAVTAAAILVVLALVVPQVVEQRREAEIPAGPGGPNLASVDLKEDMPRDHVDSEIDYPEVPPMGGAHDEEWLTCGRYDQAVREENAVHSIEHGALWITYDPEQVSKREVTAMYEKLPEKRLISPYVGLPGPVVITAWQTQLVLDGPDDPRLDLFIDEYGDGHTAPEATAECVNGVVKYEESNDTTNGATPQPASATPSETSDDATSVGTTGASQS